MNGLLPRFGPPPDASLDGHRVDALMRLTALLTGSCLAFVLLLLAVLLVRYRARPGRRAVYERGESRWHAISVVVLAVLVFVSMDVNLARIAHADLRRGISGVARAGNVLRVEVMPQQFAWNVRYAGPDGRFATADDALSFDELRVPIGTPVHVALAARDVIHSFFVPAFRVKQDAIPGRLTHTWFEATMLGRFEIACAQLCGVGHDRMRGELRVVSREAFTRWVADRSAQSAASFDPRDAPANWGWDWVE